MKLDKGNILIASDMHFPFEKEGYIDFLLDMQKKYKAGIFVNIGDEADLCATSQYKPNPDGLSAGDEYQAALKKMKIMYKAFKSCKLCIGNHSSRMFRLAHDSGLSKKFLKSYPEIWEAPKTWEWADSWDINNVHFTHGTKCSGPNAALKIAMNLRRSTVIGHIHTEASIQYNVSAIDAIFGMICGSGIDDRAYAFHYAKDNIKKSIVSCGLVLENGTLPVLELMKL